MLFPESRLGLVSNSLLDALLSDLDYSLSTKSPAQRKMLTDIKENEAGYELAIEVPGFDKQDLKLELKDGYLTVSASHSTEAKEEQGQMIRQERFSGSSKRSFYVGKYVEKEDIKAKYDKGILTIQVPKKEAKKIEEKQSIDIQ